MKKVALMEKCFNCFADLGLHGTGIRTLVKHCGYNTSMIYTYFKDLDVLIIQSTEYCISKVEDEFMAKAPTDVEALLSRRPLNLQRRILQAVQPAQNQQLTHSQTILCKQVKPLI
ncbi:MAG: TetR/AcrR family transcriptional regulator [Ruminococcus sp.]